MMDLNTLIWRLTGWVCPAWSRRDNDGRLRYWEALVQARQQLSLGQSLKAYDIVTEALKWR